MGLTKRLSLIYSIPASSLRFSLSYNSNQDAFHKGMKDLDKVSLSMARLGKIDLRGEPISGFLLVLKVRSAFNAFLIAQE